MYPDRIKPKIHYTPGCEQKNRTIDPRLLQGTPKSDPRGLSEHHREKSRGSQSSFLKLLAKVTSSRLGFYSLGEQYWRAAWACSDASWVWGIWEAHCLSELIYGRSPVTRKMLPVGRISPPLSYTSSSRIHCGRQRSLISFKAAGTDRQEAR